MQGKIIKGIAGFYYVHTAESGIYECKAKGIFRNQKIKPLVGDNVRLTILNEEEKTGSIEELLHRTGAVAKKEHLSPSGRSQYGSGSCHFRSGKAKAEFQPSGSLPDPDEVSGCARDDLF